MVLAAHSMGPFEKYLVLSEGSSVRAREQEPRVADDNLCRFEEAVEVRHGVEMGLYSSHSMHPMERYVAMEEYDPGTSTQAYRLPTTFQARRHHRHSGRYRHTWDIVGTWIARRRE